jgi:hypothetical protein
MLLKRGGAAATRIRRNAAGFLPALGPNHHHARAKFVRATCPEAARRMSDLVGDFQYTVRSQ